MSKSLKVISSTIDPKQTKIFTKLSTVWWDAHDQLSALHPLNIFVLTFMQEKLGSYVDFNKGKSIENLKILDVGCGGGIVSEPLTRAGSTVIGIDINHSLIEVAKSHAKLDPSLEKLSYYTDTIEHHADKNAEKYDVVISNFVLQHIRKHNIFLQSCIKCLKPGGLIITSGISKTWLAWLAIKIYGERIARYMPIDAHNWELFINQSDVEQILEKYDCKMGESRGFYYNNFTKHWFWTKNKQIFYITTAFKKNLC